MNVPRRSRVQESGETAVGLVVEDQTFVRSALAACLRAAGVADARFVDGVVAARENLAAGLVADIAVVELRLKDGSGLELLPELRRRDIPVLLLTTANDRYSVRAAYAAGATAYLLKSAPEERVAPLSAPPSSAGCTSHRTSLNCW